MYKNAFEYPIYNIVFTLLYKYLPMFSPFQYCLRWTRHAYMLSDALELNKNEISTNFQEDPLLDLTIHLDDGSVMKLHSVVLAAGSDYFQSLGQVGFLITCDILYILFRFVFLHFYIRLSVLAGSGHNTPTIQYSTSNTQYR